MATTKDKIAVCVPAFRRTHMLERLLRNLAVQSTDGLFEISIVVVDNDARCSQPYPSLGPRQLHWDHR